MRAFIGLGSNLEDPIAQVNDAIALLDETNGLERIATSLLYASPPMGPQDQPDYINAVVEVETLLAPLAVLNALQSIENCQGRVRERRWGPRTLDLDLLAYGEVVMHDERLQLPHPGITERAFVLVPWAEIAADFEIIGLGKVQVLADACPLAGLEKINT